MTENEKKDEILELINKLREKGFSPEIYLLFEGTKPLKVMIKDAIRRDNKELLSILNESIDAEKAYFRMVRLLRSIKDYPWVVDRTIVERAIRLVIQYEYEFGNFVDEIIAEKYENARAKIETLNMLAERINDIIKDFEDSISSF